MKVKFVDLQRQNKILKDQIIPIVEKVILDADFNMGPRLEKFEKSFAKYVGKKFAVGVNSGTDALLLSLMAYGIGEGDEVIVPANSYFASAMVVSNLKAKPILIDIEQDYHTINVSLLEKAITSKTKAIMPVHIFGQSAEMEPILKLARKYKLFVIEDACQAHGAKYKGKMVPVGETGAFSFYPGKNLGAFGDGGAVVTDNSKIANKILHLRNDGALKKYHHKMLGIKSRLDTIQSAVLSAKLPDLEKWNRMRKRHADLYTKLLSNIPQVKTPKIRSREEHVFHLYVVEVLRRDKLREHLSKAGIETVIHYPTPIHLQPPYKNKNYKKGSFPVTEQKSKSILSLPMFPELTEEEIVFVASSIKNFYAKR